MSIINISIPNELKVSAEMLVKSGYYSSFSDVVQISIRGILKN